MGILVLYHPGGCSTLVVDEETPPFHVKCFEYPEIILLIIITVPVVHCRPSSLWKSLMGNPWWLIVSITERMLLINILLKSKLHLNWHSNLLNAYLPSLLITRHSFSSHNCFRLLLSVCSTCQRCCVGQSLNQMEIWFLFKTSRKCVWMAESTKFIHQ